MRVYVCVYACERETSTYTCSDNKMSRNHKAVLPNFCFVLTYDEVYICCLHMFNETAQQKF